nr:alpha carbonic anhydrase 7-like [Tanacetum cinerariifolium]
KRYYRYIVALTVPPCTEQAIWTISRKVNLRCCLDPATTFAYFNSKEVDKLDEEQKVMCRPLLAEATYLRLKETGFASWIWGPSYRSDDGC